MKMCCGVVMEVITLGACFALFREKVAGELRHGTMVEMRCCGQGEAGGIVKRGFEKRTYCTSLAGITGTLSVLLPVCWRAWPAYRSPCIPCSKNSKMLSSCTFSGQQSNSKVAHLSLA